LELAVVTDFDRNSSSIESHTYPILKSFINDIQNAPMIENLTLSDTVTDLETLHDNAIMLQKSKLEGAFVSQENSSKMIIANKAAQIIRSFLIQFRPVSILDLFFDREDFQNYVIKWLSYIKQKYQRIENLELLRDP
jgi:hypothetical protein